MKLGTFASTVAHLKLRQILARIRFLFRRVHVGRIEHPEVTELRSSWREAIPSRTEFLGATRFAFLNSIVELSDSSSWNDSRLDKLLLYHLHYLDVLHAGSEGPTPEQGRELIRRWIDNNPPAHGNGWEPYALSLRIVNLIKWHFQVSHLDAVSVESLYLQARALRRQLEYHLLANHLFVNAKALYFAGLFFGGSEANEWKHVAKGILTDELEEQILDDGGHFELSPMYHALILADVLDLINLQTAYADDALRGLEDIAARMLNWLAVMTHADGHLARFNDSTDGVAPELLELEQYAGRLGIEHELPSACEREILPASGYCRFVRGPARAIIDVGRIGPDYQPGHGHCDCLSFELSLYEQRFLVNTGVSTYARSARRTLERQTAAHNTVSIEGIEQSDVWAAFRVGRRARPTQLETGDFSVSAAHDGFRNVNVTHRRSMSFDESRMTIVDSLEGDPGREGIAHFHFAPGVSPRLNGNSVDTESGRLTFDNADDIQLVEYQYAAGFYYLVPAMKLHVRFREYLKSTCDYANSVH